MITERALSTGGLLEAFGASLSIAKARNSAKKAVFVAGTSDHVMTRLARTCPPLAVIHSHRAKKGRFCPFCVEFSAKKKTFKKIAVL